MAYIKVYFIILLFIVFGVNLPAQTYPNTDSLKIELSLAEEWNKKEQILYKLAEAFQFSDTALSHSYGKELTQLGEKNGPSKYTIKTYLALSNMEWKRSNNTLALKYAYRAKELADELDFELEYAHAIIRIGNIYTTLGDFSKNADFLYQALGIYEKLNDKKSIAYAYSSIAGSYHGQKNIDKALEYELKSLPISREINNTDGISRSLNNLGTMYGDLKDYENQELYYREALRESKKLGSELGLAITYFNIAKASSKLSNFDTSFYYNNKALNIFKGYNNTQLLAGSYLLSAENYHLLKQHKQGLMYTQKALQIGSDNGLLEITHHSYKVLQELYSSMGNMDSAFKYSILQYQIKDSLDLESTLIKLSQTEMKYEFEKILQENENKQKHKEYRFIILTVIICSVSVLLILFLIFRHKIKTKNNLMIRRQLEANLEIKNKELASNAMSIIKSNEVLAEIADSLMKVRKEAVKEETKFAIKKIATKIKKTTQSNIWEDFELRFQQVHKGFYDNLIDKYPNLTPNELRLCALLRLNLSNKEISELTGQRTSALEMARIRLRKKLGITDRKTNLVIFLSDF